MAKKKESTKLLIVTGLIAVVVAPMIVSWAYSNSPADPPLWLWIGSVVGVWGSFYSGALKTAARQRKLDGD